MENNFDELKREMDNVNRFVPYTLGELLAMDIKEYPFLVEKLVPEKSIIAITGHPESGKTWFVMYLIYCVVYGQPLLGMYKAQKANVLFVDEEGGKYEMARRYKLVGFKNDVIIHTLSQQGIMIDSQEDTDSLIGVIKNKEIGLVVFDPFAAIFSGDENSARDIGNVMRSFERVIVETQATIVFIHHHRKDSKNYSNGTEQSMRGSSAIFGRIDSHIIITKRSESEGEMTMAVIQRKSRKGRGKIKAFTVKMVEKDGLVQFEYMGEEPQQLKLSKAETAKEKVLKFLIDRRATFNEIHDSMKGEIGRDSLGSALKELIHEGKVASKKEAHGKPFYWVAKEKEGQQTAS